MLPDIPSIGSNRAMLVVAGVAFALGSVVGIGLTRLIAGLSSRDGKPQYPRDWPPARDLFTQDPDPNKPGYLTMPTRQALGSGHTPLGRTYPRARLFPDIFPLRELRRRVEWWTSRPVWIPYMKRFQHLGVLGATGKGKSTAFVIPQLVYGSLEKNSAYFVIDVKSPQFLRYFGQVYRDQGKEVIYFDPFTPDETLAFEPLWRSNVDIRDELAEVISTYTTATGSVSETGNSEFFKDAAKRTTRALLDLATYWPRQYCNLPCVQQLIAAGGKAITEAFEAIVKKGSPVEVLKWEDSLRAPFLLLLEAPEEGLRAGYNKDAPVSELRAALSILNRAGYQAARLVQRMRPYVAAHRAGKLDATRWAQAEAAFWSELEEAITWRRSEAERLVASMGEFITMPDDTKNSVVSTITNKTNWFREGNLAKAFSRDELDLTVVTEKPCLFLVGAPMARLQMGSLFVSSMLTNLVLNSVFERGMRMEQGAKGVSSHGIFLMLDEFVQLNIRTAPRILATFRGFKSGLTMIIQERGQLKNLYGEDATTMEGNTVHKVLLQGAHEDSAEYYAEKAIGRVVVTKRSKSHSGTGKEGRSTSESQEEVALMSGPDVKQMRLNGRMMPKLALSIGADVPAFPIRPVQYWDDPTIRSLMKMKRKVVRTDKNNKPSLLRFWEWKELWGMPEDATPYLTRRPSLKTAPPREDQFLWSAWERQTNPFTQVLDFLLGPPAEKDALTVPSLRFRAIGLSDATNPLKGTEQAKDDPMHGTIPWASGGSSPAAHPLPRPPQETDAPLVVPFAQDFRILLGDDFMMHDHLEEVTAATGTLDERLDQWLQEGAE